MIAHPRKAQLRAHADGEGSGVIRARVSLHLLGCATCRARVETFAAERAAVSAALRVIDAQPDVAEAWARVQQRAGLPDRQHQQRQRLSWGSAAVGAVAAAMAWVVVGPMLRASETPASSRVATAQAAPRDPAEQAVDELMERVQRLVAGLETAFAPRAEDQQLVAAALLSLRRGADAHVRNVCCGDYDAGGPSDDGLLTLNRPGQDVTTVVIYEDVDGSGDFSDGDFIRFVSQRAHAELAGFEAADSPMPARPS